MKLVECDSKKNQVVKHNDLMKAQGALSSNSKKMLSMLISMIKSNDSEFQEYALHIDSYEKAIGRKSNDVEALKNNALELMRNPFELKKGIYFNWCNKVDITTLNGYIIFKVDNELKPYLLNLQNNFTKYQLVNVLKLRGTYSPRFYEYLIMRYKTYKNEYFKEHKKYPKSYTFEVSIDFLRTTYKIPASYNYADIKKQIINKAQKDFKEYTDIQFIYKEQKIGRKVDRLIITVKDNNRGSNDFLSDLQSFIKYMRKNYINKDVWKGQGMILTISENGRIYNKKTLGEYNKKDSLKVWQNWYELAKNKQLPCIR